MELTGIWFLVPLGVLVLMFLVDVFGQMIATVRRLFTPDAALASATYSAGFSLRRPDSVLRERFHRPPPRGRTTEICKDKHDPYDV